LSTNPGLNESVSFQFFNMDAKFPVNTIARGKVKQEEGLSEVIVLGGGGGPGRTGLTNTVV
jgi:hypothetical protein